MTERYKARGAGGLFNTGITPRQAPDYSGLADAALNAFALTRQGIVQRAIMQQQADLARKANDRADQQFELQKKQFDAQQRKAQIDELTAISTLGEKGYREVDASQPQIGDDGKPLPVQRVGERAFILDNASTPQAKRAKFLESDTKLTPEERDFLKSDPKAFESYISTHYGPASLRESPEEKVQSAIDIAKATRGIPTYHDLHPDASPHFSFTVGTDPSTGQPTVYAGNTKTGQVTSTGVAKPVGGASGGTSGSQAPLDDMVERLTEIEGHAKDLAAGKWKITPTMQTREGLTYGIARETASGKTPVGKQLGAQAMDLLGAGGGKDFERYQALMNSTRALGDDVAKVFKGRQNEESVLREVALAQLTPDDYRNATVVNQKLSRLRNVIKLARITNPAQAKLEGGAGSIPASGNPFSDLIPTKKK